MHVGSEFRHFYFFEHSHSNTHMQAVIHCRHAFHTLQLLEAYNYHHYYYVPRKIHRQKILILELGGRNENEKQRDYTCACAKPHRITQRCLMTIWSNAAGLHVYTRVGGFNSITHCSGAAPANDYAPGSLNMICFLQQKGENNKIHH